MMLDYYPIHAILWVLISVLISRPRLRNSVEFQQFMGRLADENLIFPQPLFGEDIDPEDLDSGESKDVTIETKEKGDNSGETSTTTKVTYSNYRTFTFREPQNKSFKIKIPSIAYFSVYIYNKEQERQQSKKKTKVFTKSSSLLDLRKVVPSTQRGSFMVPNSSWNGNSIPLIDSNGHLPGSTASLSDELRFDDESVASNRKTPILRLQMTNESLAVHYPLTDTILLLLCQLLQPHDSVFCVSTVQQALLSFFGKNIENVISSGIKEFLRNFGWDYYFNYLHTFLWPEGIWLANASSNSTIDDEGEIRRNAEEWMTKGCNCELKLFIAVKIFN
ncbi:uncharacterized protein TRIADDRAFT_58922 [Trichoplax adhaerens]|uniref:Uncharacterized protein n=1 Tax=Trichoplax adhaerens TaxID=10228 RepID=B3S418_TRIAD|nr:predicted protein [Trichoplax adhaerens]EDV22382.1 predicted protein [Trichoplax adhaerens]|eukprot:XP_002114926.1 predicted protein [Trichoplax adhaerens]